MNCFYRDGIQTPSVSFAPVFCAGTYFDPSRELPVRPLTAKIPENPALGIAVKRSSSLFTSLIILERALKKCWAFKKCIGIDIKYKENHNSFMHSIPCIYGHVGVNSLPHLLPVMFGDSPLLEAGNSTVVSRVFLHSLTQCVFIQRPL